MAKADITPERLRELLHYDPETGVFTRKKWMGGTSRIGTVAGTVTTGGYINIGVAGTIYRAHRLAWLYVHGDWPKADIDHMNGNPGDNKIANLRDVTRQVNNQNRREARAKRHESPLGVGWHKGANRWASYIRTKDGKTKYLGLFDDPDEAHRAYLQAKRLLHEGCTI